MFDRVESSANPIDGVSRGKMEGPWGEVIMANVPKGLSPVLSEELSRRGVCVDERNVSHCVYGARNIKLLAIRRVFLPLSPFLHLLSLRLRAMWEVVAC